MFLSIALCAALAAASAPAISVANFRDGETIRYPVPLLRGTIGDAAARSLAVVNTSSDRPTRELPALVHEGKFKALTELVPGPNRIVLRAGASELALTITYQPQTNSRVVRVFYLTDKGGDATYQTQIEKDPQDHAAKLDTAFKILQSFTAETLNDGGLGRHTFNLELDEAGRVKVLLFAGEHEVEHYYGLEDGAWWGEVNAEIQRRMPNPLAKDVAIAAYTRFDPATRRVRGHTALGGGAFALFGGGALFSWPSGLGDVFRAFGDPRAVDPARVHDDSAGRGTFWGLASTTMGATLHELCHTFDLPHSSDPFDIMSRGFDHLNRFFTFVEPPPRGGGEPLRFGPEQATRLCAHTATALRAHRWLALDARDFRDSGGPTISFSEKPEGVRIEAPNGLRFLGIDREGDTVDHRAFWDGAAPREFFLPKGEILGGQPVNAHFRVTDDEGLMAFASWSSFVPPAEFVRAWQFSSIVQDWTRYDDFAPVDEEKLAAIERSALAARRRRSREAFVDFARRLPAKTSSVAAYAARIIRSDRARTVKLLAGSDDALRVWLNGKLVLSCLELRPAQPDQNSCAVDLVAGENRLLVEVSQADGGWGLYLRIEDPGDGTKLELTRSGELRALGATDERAPGPLYLDHTRPVEERVADLIGRLTLEEKATLLNHNGPDVERFGIRSDKWNQCLHGVCWDRPTTMFPVSIAMAATWDPELVHAVATAISDEARAIYNGWHKDPGFTGQKKGLIYRAPVINISRNPYWGRINECYGEDPHLTGRIGVAFVKGLQGSDPRYLKLVSTLKHFAVNNVEKDRMKLSASVSERMLHEYWLPHFKDCIVEGGALSVMASYNAINGVPNNVNRLLLTDILKGQWGFQGFVVSDLGGVKTMVEGHRGGAMSFEDAVAQSLVAGCDFSDKEFMTHIPAAVRRGILPEARVDDALARVLRARFRLGEFDPFEIVPFSAISMDVICSPAHRRLALATAQKAIVLLQNRDKLLPLDPATKRIAVVGPLAARFIAGGYSGKAKDPVTPLRGLRNRAGPGVEILFDEDRRAAVDLARKADVAIAFVGTTLDDEAEGRDRTTLAPPGDQEAFVREVVGANPRAIVVLMSAGPLAISWIKERAPAIVQAWWAGEEGGNAIADVIFGAANPAGRLPWTMYESDAQVPPQDAYDISRGFTYMYCRGRPLFPFGHGLSYTDFAYDDLKVSPGSIAPDGTFTVSIDVRNAGGRAGDEVVQLYVRDLESSVTRPAKELRGFKRISLAPGERRTVSFELPGSTLAFYDEATHAFVVEPGAFDIMVGSSSEDIRARAVVEVTAAPGRR